MTGAFIQDVIVTAVMLLAAATIARRVLGFAVIKDGGGKSSAGCEKCAMAPLNNGHQGQAAAVKGSGSAGVTVHPVVLLRKPTSSQTTSA